MRNSFVFTGREERGLTIYELLGENTLSFDQSKYYGAAS